MDYALHSCGRPWTWGVGVSSGVCCRRTCGFPDQGKAHFLSSTRVGDAATLASAAAAKVEWSAIEGQHAVEGPAPRVLVDAKTAKQTRKQTVALPRSYFPRGSDAAADADDDSSAARLALGGPAEASPWAAKRCVAFRRPGDLVTVPPRVGNG